MVGVGREEIENNGRVNKMSVTIKQGKKSSVDKVSLLNGKKVTLPEVVQHLINILDNEDMLHPDGMGSEMTMDFIIEALDSRKIDATLMGKYKMPSKTQINFLKNMGVI